MQIFVPDCMLMYVCVDVCVCLPAHWNVCVRACKLLVLSNFLTFS